jgi:hypothetical protein
MLLHSPATWLVTCVVVPSERREREQVCRCGTHNAALATCCTSMIQHNPLPFKISTGVLDDARRTAKAMAVSVAASGSAAATVGSWGQLLVLHVHLQLIADQE